ncbi:MAG: hypothetical protein BGP12_10010 [Rhodospirillales bacterium 70-18]|nr:MAG: hypothetical protein BGP12_10010 [Rhodospirillales bacterium 70-18]
MKNADMWKETKYVLKSGRLAASPDPREVSISSRLIASLVAASYQGALGAHATGRLLDLGCGSVPLYASYKPYVTEITCVDWENTSHRNIHLDQEADLSQPLPFGDATFDTIILSDVLEHIPVPQSLWNEMNRVLARGGKIILNVPFYYWLHEQPHDYYRYTRFALQRFVQNSDMKMIELKEVGGAPEILADITSKMLMGIPLVGAGAAAILQGLTLWFVRTGIGRRISRRTARGFPFGYFMVAEKC